MDVGDDALGDTLDEPRFRRIEGGRGVITGECLKIDNAFREFRPHLGGKPVIRCAYGLHALESFDGGADTTTTCQGGGGDCVEDFGGGRVLEAVEFR